MKVIFLDLGGTLVNNSKFSWEEFLQVTAQLTGAGLDSVERHFEDFYRGREGSLAEVRYVDFLRRLTLDTSALTLMNMEFKAADAVTGPLFPAASALLARLLGAGFKVVIVSNSTFSGLSLHYALARRGINLDPAAVFSSADFKIRKPDPELLHAVLKETGLAPEGALFAGDVPEIDGALAEAYGMQFCLTQSGDYREIIRYLEKTDGK